MYKKTTSDGDIFYYKDAEMTTRHRIDGPAMEYSDGTKVWYLHGKRHRIDGPAIEWAYGDKSWCLNGFSLEFQAWKRAVRKYYDNHEDYLLMLLKLD